MRLSSNLLYRITASCPKTGEPIVTHARMTMRQFSRLRGELGAWCPHCRDGHAFPRAALSLQGAPPPRVERAEPLEHGRTVR
jgi:hypothetical protein